MLTLSEIRSRGRVRFEATSSTRWSDADWNDAINDGLECLSEATGYYEQWVSIPLKENRTYYDLRGWMKAPVLSVTGVWHEAANRWLESSHWREFATAQWERTTGNPICWFTRGLWWLGIYPHPTADLDQWLRVYHSATAPRMAEDGEEPKQLPDEFVPALEEYAMYELTQRDGDSDKALYWYGKYKQREAALAEHVNHRVTTARVGAIGR